MAIGHWWRVITPILWAAQSWCFSTLFRVMIATVLLGVIGGFFSAASTLNRVERLNREISRIIRSDPGQRLQVEREEGYVRALAWW